MILSDKKVSVIIPTYQRDIHYLSRAINSIMNQTYKNIEIVLVDDNLSNSTYRDCVKQYISELKSPSIVYIMNEKNIGGALARNRGIATATGEYITFLDDDDEYLPSKIEDQLAFMLKYNYDMTFTELKLVNDKKEIVDYREFNFLKTFDNKSLLKYHIMRHLTGTPTFMYKTEKLREIGGFEDAKVGQEFYLMVKTIEGNLNIGYFKNCNVLAYRHSGSGISNGSNKIKGEKTLFEFKKSYFHLFEEREKMFIRFRHYAVMSIAYKRNKKYIHALVYAIKMILASPLDFIQELFKYILNLLRHRRLEN
jgi:glycosyltransferase involved in cell wall biosynthesis